MDPARATSLEPQWLEQGREERTRSLGRDTRRRAMSQARGSTSGTGGLKTETLPANLRQRAVVNQRVDPFTDFPSLRRGFTLNGQPIPPMGSTEEKLAIIKVKEESSAYFFWAIYITLVLLAVGNLVTTLIVVHVLRVGPVGMEAIDFLPENLGIRLFGAADLGRVHKLDGIISSFAGESLNIRGDGAKVEMQAGQHENAPRLTVSPELVSLEGVHDFSVIHPETGEVLFSTSDPELTLPEGLQKLEAEEAEVSRVTAPVGEDLLVRSDANLIVRGSEGIQIGGKTVSLTSASDISLRSEEGAVELSGGVVLDTVMLPHGGGGYSGEVGQFQLCICMPSGLLFKVAIPTDNPTRPPQNQVGCHSVDLVNDNPCRT